MPIDRIEASGPVEDAATGIPVVEEQVRVKRRLLESSRATVHITVREHDEAVQALLMRQDVTIERVAVGTRVTEPVPIRQDGDTVIVPVFEERLVTETQLFLKEELRIRIDETKIPTSRTITLRREHADINHHERDPT